MNAQKILRLPAVQDMTGKSRSGIYSDIGRGLFPAPIKLGRRAIGWRTEDIEVWIASRVSTRPSCNAGAR